MDDFDRLKAQKDRIVERERREIAESVAGPRISELETALTGLLGLITLIADRDDLPLPIREALITNHRTREANRVTANLWLGSQNLGISPDFRDGWIAAIEEVSRYLDEEAAESSGLKDSIRHLGTMMRKNCLPPRRLGIEG